MTVAMQQPLNKFSGLLDFRKQTTLSTWDSILPKLQVLWNGCRKKLFWNRDC